MKKKLLLLSFICLVSEIYGQNTLRELIRGEKGTTKHYLSLLPNQQVTFNPSNIKKILSLEANSDLILTNSETDETGQTNYRFYQTYQKIPVEGSMYIVHTKKGKTIAMSGEMIIDFPIRPQTHRPVSISSKQAIDAAVNYVHAKEYMWQNPEMEKMVKEQTGKANASYAPKAKLVWFNNDNTGEDYLDPSRLVLAYKIDVYAYEPLSRAYYFVDAQTGKILGKHDIINTIDATGTANTSWSGTQTIHSDFSNGKYHLRDYTKGNGVVTLHGENDKRGQNYRSPTANWDLHGTDRAAMDAHFGVSATYDFYFKFLYRNSFDDRGTALYSYVNDPSDINNAFWDGAAMNFNKLRGSNGGVTGIDVCGHELTHGVTQESCALIYEKESGAINESLSDILGKCVQFYTKPNDINWQISNDMNWIIRDLSNPKSQNQPDTYKGSFWVTSIFNDNGGVHTNSGVGNYMFYLLVNGGSGTNDNGDDYSVAGIGQTKAARIIYRTQTVYLFPNAQYQDWRTACINAAKDLYGPSSEPVAQVKNAFQAAGVGKAAFVEVIASATGSESLLKEPGITTPYLKITPNIISESEARISYQLVKEGNSVLRIVDMNGHTIRNMQLGKLQPGVYMNRLTDVGTLPKGSYIIVMEQNGVIVTRNRFIVLR